MAYEKIGFTDGQVLTADDLNHMEDVIADNEGGSGEDGGYYIISLDQTSEDKVTVSYSASKTNMQALPDEFLTLPKGADGYTPVRGTDYWTAADKAEIVADVVQSFVNAEEVAY